jgi:hypothetical protein
MAMTDVYTIGHIFQEAKGDGISERADDQEAIG